MQRISNRTMITNHIREQFLICWEILQPRIQYFCSTLRYIYRESQLCHPKKKKKKKKKIICELIIFFLFKSELEKLELFLHWHSKQKRNWTQIKKGKKKSVILFGDRFFFYFAGGIFFPWVKRKSLNFFFILYLYIIVHWWSTIGKYINIKESNI